MLEVVLNRNGRVSTSVFKYDGSRVSPNGEEVPIYT